MIQDKMDLVHQSCKIFAANHLLKAAQGGRACYFWFFLVVPKGTFCIFFILANMYITEESKRDKDRSSHILSYKILAYYECVIFQSILLFFKDNENDVGQTLQTYQCGKFVPYLL